MSVSQLSPHFLCEEKCRWVEEIEECVDSESEIEECVPYLESSIDLILDDIGKMPWVKRTIFGLKKNEYKYNQGQSPSDSMTQLPEMASHFSFLYTARVPSGGLNRIGMFNLRIPVSDTRRYLERCFRLYESSSSLARARLKKGNLLIFPSDLVHWLEPNLAKDEPLVTITGHININT
jgi:hypothetical protein